LARGKLYGLRVLLEEEERLVVFVVTTDSTLPDAMPSTLSPHSTSEGAARAAALT
jgi:hypothetical protein